MLLPLLVALCSFTSLWFLSTTTPSIYSLVGSLNKVGMWAVWLAVAKLQAYETREHLPFDSAALCPLMPALVAYPCSPSSHPLLARCRWP